MNLSRSALDTAPKPIIAVTLGDPAGIGPELVAKLLDDARIMPAGMPLVIGDPWVLEQGQEISGTRLQMRQVSAIKEARVLAGDASPLFFAMNTIPKEAVANGQACAAAGASVLHVLRTCLDAVTAGDIDAICFAPLNKHAMKLAGLKFEDELHFFANYLGVHSYVCEFNTLGELWTSRISSHIPFRRISEFVTRERIVEAAILTHRSLVQTGIPEPRIALAALNPHAGDGGTCGREEIEVMTPALRELDAMGVAVVGPLPADTIFLRARAGEFDAVVTMYHDQGQIAIKLMGFERGVTVQGGLPVPITTPAHGTAFDIAGRNKANVEATVQAYLIAARMGAHHRMQSLAGETNR